MVHWILQITNEHAAIYSYEYDFGRKAIMCLRTDDLNMVFPDVAFMSINICVTFPPVERKTNHKWFSHICWSAANKQLNQS